MIPTIDERLASVVRALTEVVLPHLPPEASLAQEQVHLAVGHLQILRAQIDASPAFEREELEDATALAAALRRSVRGGDRTQAALAILGARVDDAGGASVRDRRKAVHEAIEGLIRAASDDGDSAARAALTRTILQFESARTEKDRRWFAPFGFDTL
jgi:hypothetical protein